MIPIKLSMRNFMCYRDNIPPLYFDSIHTTCITGDNGNGKSALIDAMTWALWGRTRAKSDDDLIHQGQMEMEVEFDFAVGGQTYRIIRKHSKPRFRGRSGQSSLDLQIASRNNGFRSISGNTIPETQVRICGILHMDYETFTNSAFLRQGNADEFTKNQPSKRKEVLANILGLSIYDRLEERAKELARDKEAGKANLESAIQEINNELAQKPTYQNELEQAQQELLRIEEDLKQRELVLNDLRKKKELLESKKSQLTQLEEHISNIQRNLGLWEGEIKERQLGIKSYEELIAQRSSIEEGYARFTQTKSLNEELDQRLRQSTILTQRKHQLEMAIAEKSQHLLREHALVESKIGELQTKKQKLPQLKSELEQVQRKLSELAEEEETLHQKRQTSQELRSEVKHLESSNSRLEQEIKEMEEKLGLLLTQSGAKCPLCQSKLGKDGLRRIEKKYTVDKQSKTESLKSNQAELVKKKTELESLESEIPRIEAKLNQEKAQAQGGESVKKKEISEAEAAQAQLSEAKDRLAQIEGQLVRKDFAPTEKLALQQIEDELTQLGYDSQQHEEVRQRLANLREYENSKRKLDEASRLLSQEKEAALRATETVREQGELLKDSRRKAQDLSQELILLPQVSSDLTQAETGYRAMAQQQRQAQEMMGSAKGRLERCLELEGKKKEKERLLSQVAREEQIYKELVQAFGKRGVPALIIEKMALPEIEVEANRLLGRMTEGRMHLKIETQRETKKGDVLETLDINISDELGTRNYEMFSGGEAFRINFAIRIALSKLLARRAGAPLLTLIIDEGFGTQDSTGIEKLKEAINSIQDDFEKIFVITHIEELRDAFPTRINVTKTAEGSTLSLS